MFPQMGRWLPKFIFLIGKQPMHISIAKHEANETLHFEGHKKRNRVSCKQNIFGVFITEGDFREFCNQIFP